ncbi:MAG: DNA-binding protein WhiA [Candidatus Atribacteria bacterium]|nr:DNA-binding protein WhiA [Candidatus Atribacteria bacterium]
MYFSSMAKQELARILPQDSLKQKSELLAFIMMRGFFDQSKGLLFLLLEDLVIIKVVYFLFKKVFQYEVTIQTLYKTKKKKYYMVTISGTEELKEILEKFTLKVNSKGKLIPEYPSFKKNILLSEQFDPSSFLRGAFLAGGFVNDPERMYHLEISSLNRDEIKMIHRVLQKASFSAKISFWKKRWVAYIKKSEEIFEFLRFIGIQRALLNLQDIIARKDILNTVNRLVNCETANLDKTILSASRQLHCIDIVEKSIGFDNLTESLMEVIQARREHPYANIQELAAIVGGDISKSGIFHRLKKIEKLAEDCLSNGPFSIEE